MSLAEWGHPAGILGRSTIAEDSPGQTRITSYVDSAGVETNEFQKQMRVFNNLGSALVKGGVYKVLWTGNGKCPQLVAVAADTVNHNVAVATEAAANQKWTWAVVAGHVDALVEGTTDVAIGDFLKLVTATAVDAFIKDGAAKTAKSFAVAEAAQAADSKVATKVLLMGHEADLD